MRLTKSMNDLDECDKLSPFSLENTNSESELIELQKRENRINTEYEYLLTNLKKYNIIYDQSVKELTNPPSNAALLIKAAIATGKTIKKIEKQMENNRHMAFLVCPFY